MLKYDSLTKNLDKLNTLTTDFKVKTSSPGCFQRLEKINDTLERTTILSRNLLETSSKSVLATKAKPASQATENIEIAGKVRLLEYTWLHIQLNTLLPNSRFQPPAYLSDTITRLLDNFQRKGGKIPFYKKAMLIIDEHCSIAGRTVFDQDNKSWKAVSNALKGRLFPDDDQFSMGISLVSTESEDIQCNIYVIDFADSGDFFSLKNEGMLF